MDIRTLLAQMDREATTRNLSLNPLAQFGTAARQYLGPTLLPERNVPENAFREEAVKYRTVLANAGTRYSPTQKKKGVYVGAVDVILANSDIASEFTSRDYDGLIQALRTQGNGGTPTQGAVASLVRWLDTTVNIPLIELNEVWRWQAIVDAKVQARGDNDYSEDFTYPNPPGLRVPQTAAWSTNSTDIWDQIQTQAQLLTNRGYSGFRFITSRRVLGIMSQNATVKQRAGHITVAAGVLTAATGRASLSAINSAFGDDGLPPLELYDLVYRTSTGTGRFLKNDVFVIVGMSGRDEAIDLGDSFIEVVPNTLGYVGVGRPAGQSTAGRVIRQEAFDNKPPRIEAEGWQTSCPVILEPEAISVITGIT